ncbi:Integrase core domain [Neisseria dentiae]|nr:Integrase core domain [Neisseria dentiae]
MKITHCNTVNLHSENCSNFLYWKLQHVQQPIYSVFRPTQPCCFTEKSAKLSPTIWSFSQTKFLMVPLSWMKVILADNVKANAVTELRVKLLSLLPRYSDNGVEYHGNAEHPFGIACVQNNISQKFTRVTRPQTNGKAERVIRTLMEMWHDKHPFKDSAHRQKELCRFVNFYNTVKPHKSLKGDIPFEVLQASFPTCCVNNPTISYTEIFSG